MKTRRCLVFATYTMLAILMVWGFAPRANIGGHRVYVNDLSINIAIALIAAVACYFASKAKEETLMVISGIVSVIFFMQSFFM